MAAEEDYSLYDENSDRFVIKVPAAQARILDVDHMKCYRILNQLKRRGVGPTTIEEEEDEDEVKAEEPPLSSSAAGLLAANQKTGGEWKGLRTHSFLNAACEFRQQLRASRVKDTVYWTIAAKLLEVDKSYVYSAAQLREKVRNIKRQFLEAKAGKHGGDTWEHYWMMVYLFEEDLNVANSSSLQQARMSTSVYLPILRGRSEEVAEASNSSDSPVVAILPDQSVSATTSVQNSGRKATSVRRGLFCTPNEELDNDDRIDDWIDESAWGPATPALSSTKISVETNGVADVHIRGGTAVDAIFDGPELDAFFDAPVDDSVDGAPLDDLQSPKTKKTKRTPGRIQSPRKVVASPVKTVRRKVACSQAALLWPQECTTSFIQACLARKEDVRKKVVPNDTWKSIAAELKEIHAGMTWQLCRDRFNRMNDYFLQTLLPVQGMLGGMLWPHYDSFCKLHEIPNDYFDLVTSFGGEDEELLDREDDEEGADSGELKGPVWKHVNQILLFLDLYSAKQHLFESCTSGMKHLYLHCQIASQLQDYGINVTGKQCQAKLCTLRSKFRQEYEIQSKKTGAGTTKWVFYQKMLELDGGRANIEAPVAVSVGKGIVHTQMGVTVADSKRGSRTRPAPTSQQKVGSKTDKKAKKPVYKSQKQELIESRVRCELLQQQQVENQGRIADAVEDMTQHNALQGEARTSILRDLRDTLKAIALQNLKGN